MVLRFVSQMKIFPLIYMAIELFFYKIVSEIRLQSKKDKPDLVSYARFIMGLYFNTFTNLIRRNLWGLARQRAAVNLLYNTADKGQKHAFHLAYSSPGKSRCQLKRCCRKIKIVKDQVFPKIESGPSDVIFYIIIELK